MNVIRLAQKSYTACIQSLREANDAKDLKIKRMAETHKRSIEELKREFLDTSKKEIEDLKAKLAQAEKSKQLLEDKVAGLKKASMFLEKFDISTILTQIKYVCKENEDIKDYAREIRSELEYGRQRENKLMYFLFVIQKKGFPVYDIFESEVKDISTDRFSKSLDEQYKKVYNKEIKCKYK